MKEDLPKFQESISYFRQVAKFVREEGLLLGLEVTAMHNDN